MTLPQPTALLDVRGLSLGFDVASGTAKAVFGIDFTIESGQTLGLVGESGSGKSVTALSLVGLLRPPGRVNSGQILFKGQDLRLLSERDLRSVRGAEIGFIFQEPMTALNPVMTIGNHLIEALTVHGTTSRREAPERAVQLLEAVHIPRATERMRDYPHQFSGGMRQRVCIAVAIACRPALLIADEPTTALDVTMQAEILDLLADMQRTLGLALLLISHDLTVVAATADVVAVMYAGRIVEMGPVQDVLRRPQHPYTRGLLASMPGVTRGAPLVPIPGAVPRLGSLPAGCAFHTRCAERFEPCDSAVPPLTKTDTGRSVRCFLHDSHAAR